MNIITWIKLAALSRTMQFNSVGAILLALESSMNLLQPLVSGDVYAWISAILVVGNTILRTMTKTPIKEKVVAGTL